MYKYPDFPTSSISKELPRISRTHYNQQGRTLSWGVVSAQPGRPASALCDVTKSQSSIAASPPHGVS